tara:strand:- start:868 stop:1182 length:315 start_codon:yes stop_codon:yes gene_type:complete
MNNGEEAVEFCKSVGLEINNNIDESIEGGLGALNIGGISKSEGKVIFKAVANLNVGKEYLNRGKRDDAFVVGGVGVKEGCEVDADGVQDWPSDFIWAVISLPVE